MDVNHEFPLFAREICLKRTINTRIAADTKGIMTSTIHILAIDDDKISQKFIGKALSHDDFVMNYADNGEQGIEKALSNTPDIIILDVEMPGMNGYQVCEKLREIETTKDTPVVFLSSHSTLRERMQGYEVGADDFLVKPFERDDLIAKIRVLAKYLEEQKILREQYALAQKTAYIAMTGSSELGIAMQFVEKSYAYHSFPDMAEALLQVTRQYQLTCALMIIENGEQIWYSPDEAVKPLEKEMVEMLDRSQRFIDFGARTIINFPNLSLLVKNMPLDDMERYGRIKDLLPMLLAAVDSKIISINTEQALSQQSKELLTSFGLIKGQLYYLTKTLMNNQNDSAELLNSMVTELNADLLGMGLDDDQEAWILQRIDHAIEQANEQLDASAMLYVVFSRILHQLKDMTGKQQALVDTYTQVNEASIATDPAEDDNIEFF